MLDLIDGKLAELREACERSLWHDRETAQIEVLEWLRGALLAETCEPSSFDVMCRDSMEEDRRFRREAERQIYGKEE